MYLFGEIKTFDFTKNSQKELIDNSFSKVDEFSKIPILEILEILSSVGSLWEKGGRYYSKALDQLSKELSFSQEMIEFSLNLIPGLLNKEELKKRLQSEFNEISGLDRPAFIKGQKIMYSPLGVLLHITAGNVFLGCIDSLIMGFLTKNISLIKLSSRNHSFPLLFAQSIIEADKNKRLYDKFSFLCWKGGSLEVEDFMKKSVSGIIAWGGEQMLLSYKNDLPYGTKLFDFGPKISISILDESALTNDQLYSNIAKDVCLWDQSACANCQNLFIKNTIDKNDFILKLKEAFKSYPLKRGSLEPDEYAELLKEEENARFNSFETGIEYVKGDDFFIHFETNNILRPSPLNRTLVIKTYDSEDDLIKMLSSFSPYLQTCALETSENIRLMPKLARAGIKRFTKSGSMLEGKVGAPHDGSFNLINLTNIISVELDLADNYSLNKIAGSISFYNNQQNQSFDELPLIGSKELVENPIYKENTFLSHNAQIGTIFSSGGTSGKPKFTFYSKEEFEYTCYLLSESYRSFGLVSNVKVANLFVAGNMWSSFIAIYKALENLDVIQLPIGGNAKKEDMISYIELFKPDYLFGIPSLLVDLSDSLKDLNIKIKGIFYAGERFSSNQKLQIEKNIGCNRFISAGYASVDVGPIGYQDQTCLEDEHILFDGLKLEVINNEAVVSSSIRKMMPVLRYRTGDRVKLTSFSDQVRFKLLGRVDQMIFIFGTRIGFIQIKENITNILGENSDFQLVITNSDGHDNLEIRLNRTIDPIRLIKEIWTNIADINQTLDFESFSKLVRVQNKKLILNERTGKCLEIIDKRF